MSSLPGLEALLELIRVLQYFDNLGAAILRKTSGVVNRSKRLVNLSSLLTTIVIIVVIIIYIIDTQLVILRNGFQLPTFSSAYNYIEPSRPLEHLISF